MKRAFGVATAIAAVVALGGTLPAGADSDEGGVLGPEGYKSLYLGQSESEAEETGLLIDKRPGPCTQYYLHLDEGKQHPANGVFTDPDLGVVAIGGTTTSRTPEGIAMGTPLEEVRAAYPDLVPVPPQDFVYETDVPGFQDRQYRFAVDEYDRVEDFSLMSGETGHCFD